MKTSDFDYKLPIEYIAQTPATPRDSARLMVLDRASGEIQHSIFRDVGKFLFRGDLLVINQTRVILARLFGRKSGTGGKVELLLLRPVDSLSWEVLVGGKGLGTGRKIDLEKGIRAEIIDVLDGSHRIVRFNQPVDKILAEIGSVPLPPYIHSTLSDPERYQTVYAKDPGSSAAPTAGLHFTNQLMDQLISEGIQFASLTLNIGLDTFAPVTEEKPADHKIHTEWCRLDENSVDKINRTPKKGGRIIAVGTTSVRALESAALGAEPERSVVAMDGPTDLFILPGYQFRVVEALITNFHLPKSTLLMLVSAFAGREKILDAYEIAKKEGYRFYSFGDAMLII